MTDGRQLQIMVVRGASVVQLVAYYTLQFHLVCPGPLWYHGLVPNDISCYQLQVQGCKTSEPGGAVVDRNLT